MVQNAPLRLAAFVMLEFGAGVIPVNSVLHIYLIADWWRKLLGTHREKHRAAAILYGGTK